MDVTCTHELYVRHKIMNYIPWNVLYNYTYNKSLWLLTTQKTEHLQLLTAHKF